MDVSKHDVIDAKTANRICSVLLLPSVQAEFRIGACGMLAAIVAATSAATPLSAEPKKWNVLGSLNCTMGASIGLLMAGLQKARCVFRSSGGARVTYAGRMERSGLDLGIAPRTKLAWTVVAQAADVAENSLVGSYSVQTQTDGTAESGRLLCNGAQRPVCLRPTAGAAQGTANRAFEMMGVRLE